MKIHLMGNMGSGAKAVSYLASKYGYDVTGCDIQKEGHDIDHIKDVDMVVVSPALLYSDNPPAELVEAKKQGKLLTWEEFVGKYLMKDKFVIAVSGTHGKSTTTAMIGMVLEDCGFDPTVLVGAYVPRWGANARYGKSKYFVVEADEFNDNFLHYKPDLIVVNNIEFDHPDYFKDEAQVRESFANFIKNLKPGGGVLEKPGSIKFNLKVFGQHNQINANMAYLVGEKLGIKKELIINSIENFNGIGRRMELLGKFGNTEVYSDYAHHPSAIKTTLQGLREAYPDKKILALIEPHGYKRTKALLPLYSGIFDSVDTVIVGPIFKARDMVDKNISPEDISKVSNHADITTINEIGKLKIKKDQFDVVIIMGAGNSNIWAQYVIDCLGGVTFKDLTTIKTGGKIKHFIKVRNDQEVADAVTFAKKNKLNIFVIGEGSDILVSDNDFDGVVIKHVGNSYQISKELVTADAGMTWDKLVEICVEENLQ